MGLYSGIRHNRGGVHNRLGIVSAALRKRNYHVEGKVRYRMDTKSSSNRKVRLACNSFHVKQTAN